MGVEEAEIEWVRDTASLESMLAVLGPEPVAVDVEGDSLHHYPEKVCLLQLTFAGRHVLVDPLADVDVKRLGPVLADANVRKVFHGADYDLRVLQRDFGLRVRGLFDTMIAARLVGERAFGLSALLEKYFTVRLEKKYQRADWSRRPLPSAMEAYAVMDTRYLAPLAERLEAQLSELGRSAWAEEEFERLEAVRWSESLDPQAFRRVKGSAGLHRRGLALLRELFELREGEARRRDRPPFRVMRDEQLLHLARTAPRDPADLVGIPEFWRRGRGARALLQAVCRAADCAEQDLPEIQPRTRRRGSTRRGGAWQRIRGERDQLARRLGLEPSVLAPRAALEEALERVGRGEDPARATELRRWQLSLLRPALSRVADEEV
jgi:ribonuclease D